MEVAEARVGCGGCGHPRGGVRRDSRAPFPLWWLLGHLSGGVRGFNMSTTTTIKVEKKKDGETVTDPDHGWGNSKKVEKKEDVRRLRTPDHEWVNRENEI